MYDADYEEWLTEQGEAEAKEAALRAAGYYVTKDSGTRAQHSDGVVRDTDLGKTKFTLMFPEGVPMDQQLIVRIAELYTRGGEKYGDRNWENSKSADTLKHHTDALWRHFMNFFFNVQDSEDHAAAIVWNINAVELCRRNLAKKPTRVDDLHTALAELREAELKPYVFPVPPPPSFGQRTIMAHSYKEARQVFDAWIDAGCPEDDNGS